jgi:protein-disulfide isomerase
VKRLLPLFIIVVVGLATVGIATAIYHEKMKPAPKPEAATPGASSANVAAGSASPSDESEDPKLHVRGPRNAPLTLEIYGDFQCPACSVASRVVDELQKEYQGKIKVIFHEFPLAMHKHAKEAAMAAEAAALQGKFWEMHDALYQYQDVWGQISNANFFFESYARMIGLDVEQFNADRNSMKVEDMIIEDGTDGMARGVQNTPTLFLNGTLLKAFTKDKLKEAIDAALAEKKS